MYVVNIGEYVRVKKSKTGKPYRCKTRTGFSTDSESTVAERAIEILREAGTGMRFSGMEEFGSAHDHWNDGHTCPEDGSPSNECERLELESCREWIEERVKELQRGESLDLHLAIPSDAFTEFVITAK